MGGPGQSRSKTSRWTEMLCTGRGDRVSGHQGFRPLPEVANCGSLRSSASRWEGHCDGGDHSRFGLLGQVQRPRARRPEARLVFQRTQPLLPV